MNDSGSPVTAYMQFDMRSHFFACTSQFQAACFEILKNQFDTDFRFKKVMINRRMVCRIIRYNLMKINLYYSVCYDDKHEIVNKLTLLQQFWRIGRGNLR
ncbi:hypothetical protein HA50_23335 [Pantoea cypripedii]|uniref:Uncharacterized protein n=1 Tax=Pantoea cypripedii TaxID=55209 RepID=A0A1X1EKV6_PANCY|nr:hypothetical protein [Pantoea cypripedii]ORM89555.1 hypothetical protein HA50_23335 [Pantoea cypripedii]